MQQNEIINTGQELRKLLASHLAAARSLGRIPLIVVMGPTASGKTTMGIALAKFLDGEIVSADSRQIYRRMDICTAKPTPAEMAAAKHYLVDFVEPDEDYNLARFQREATEQLQKIHLSGKTPLLVGGTGLYISSITQNYALPASRADSSLREKYEQLAQTEGVEAVHRHLAELAPHAAAQIHPNNLRYVIRALEIAIQTTEKATVSEVNPFHSLLLTIDWPREELYARIEQRIDAQIEQGLIEETAALLNHYPQKLPSLSSLGYEEIGKYLRGETSLHEALTSFKQHTRNYAKRQLTWFRRFPQVYSIPGERLAKILTEMLNQA